MAQRSGEDHPALRTRREVRELRGGLVEALPVEMARRLVVTWDAWFAGWTRGSHQTMMASKSRLTHHDTPSTVETCGVAWCARTIA